MKTGSYYDVPTLILFTALLTIPGLLWFFSGWTLLLLPVATFYCIQKSGKAFTNRHLIAGLIIALIISGLLNRILFTLFSIAVIPAGYVVAHSAGRGDDPWVATFKTTLVLSIGLFVSFSFSMGNDGLNLLNTFSKTFVNAVDIALEQYRINSNIPAEQYLALESTLGKMQTIAPKIMAAILGSILAIISWSTVVLGNTLLAKKNIAHPWPEYRYWCLPDKFVWILIISGILSLLPAGDIQLIGINCLIVSAVIYSFQGLAILIFLLKKWQVPVYLRAIIYFITFLQSFGAVLLVGLGVAEVWFDFRKLHAPTSTNENSEEE